MDPRSIDINDVFRSKIFFELRDSRQSFRKEAEGRPPRVKEKGGIVGQHSDGNILAVIPDLIEIGVDVLTPAYAA